MNDSGSRLRDLAARLRGDVDRLATRTVDLHYRADPGLAARYGPRGRYFCLQDARYHIAYLAEAVEAEEPEILASYVAWGRVLLQERGIPVDDLIGALDCLTECVLEAYGDEADEAARSLRTARDRLGAEPDAARSEIEGDDPVSTLARDYLRLLLEGDRDAAVALLTEAVERDVPVEDIYLRVLQPVQREVGALWQRGRITVADEHYCSAATQLVMSLLYARVAARHDGSGPRVTAVCAEGDLHEIGLRVVADLLELRGARTTYLGANVPIGATVDLLLRRVPDVLAVSATLPIYLHAVRRLVGEVRARPELSDVRIAVGGSAFRSVSSRDGAVGADGVAHHALEAVDLVYRLGERP